MFYPDLLSSTNIKQNKINVKQTFWAYLTYIVIGNTLRIPIKMVGRSANIVGYITKLVLLLSSA